MVFPKVPVMERSHALNHSKLANSTEWLTPTYLELLILPMTKQIISAAGTRSEENTQMVGSSSSEDQVADVVF